MDIRKFLKDYTPLPVCSWCGCTMNSGYCIFDGLEYYCCDNCLHRKYTGTEYQEMYNNDVAYWSEWEG